MHAIATLQTVYTVSGMAFFMLGLVVTVQALTQSPSVLRRRFLALAAFGLIHGVFEWFSFAALTPGGAWLKTAALAVGAASFLPLFYFALARTAAQTRPVVYGLAILAGLWPVAMFLVSAEGLGEVITLYFVAVPAAGAAAWAFAFDPDLQVSGKYSRWLPSLTASVFVLYAALQLFPSPAGVFPASVINSETFEALTGVSLLLARAATALAAACATLVLLVRYHQVAGRERQEYLSRMYTTLADRDVRLQQLLNLEPECIKTLDAQCRLFDMNAAGLAMIGADSLEAVRGRNALDLVDPQYHELFRDGVAAVFRGEQTRQRFEIIGLTGEKKWVEQNAAPLIDPENPDAIREMIAITRDITDQVHAERALQQTNNRLEEAQRIGNMGSWEWDIATNSISWSDQIYRIFGLVPQEFGVSYQGFLNRIHPDDRTAVTEAVQRALDTGETYAIDHRIVLPDGRVRRVHEQGEIIRSPQGQPAKMLGTVQDVTDIRQTEIALKKSQTSLSGILQISPEAIITTDAGGTITMFSSGAEAIFGHSRDQAIGQRIEMLMPERYRSVHGGYIAKFLDSGVTSKRMGERAEIAGLRRNGEEFPATASLSRLETEDGVILTTILRDITAEKKNLGELEEARVQAELANEAKSLFIANMNHELRTPLNAIIGFSQLLTDEQNGRPSDDTVREYAQHINESGAHLLSLINDILDVSRIEIGKSEVDADNVDIAALVESSLAMTTQLAHNAAISVTRNVAANLPDLYADRRMLLQVMLNLVTNALKFTPKNGRVEIGARMSDAGGVILYVSDTGVGMSQAEMDRIGQPFMQLDNGLNRKYQGLGLGVTIAKNLTELHGGRLSFASTPGKGTTVSVELPAHRVLAQPLKSAAG